MVVIVGTRCTVSLYETGRRGRMAEYIDDMGKRVVVSSGIGDGSYYMICRVTKSGGLHRVKSTNLPIRLTRKEAQADLDRYAVRMGWPLVEDGIPVEWDKH